MQYLHKQIIGLDFETYYDQDYTLKKLSTTAYIRSPQFLVFGVGIRTNRQKKTTWYRGFNKSYDALHRYDWSKAASLAHNSHFEGLILSHHFDIRPNYYYDTIPMGRALFGMETRASLDQLAKFLGLGAKHTDYLTDVKGIRNPDRNAISKLAAGCRQDVDLMWGCFNKMYDKFIDSELDLIHHTTSCYAQPVLKVDEALAKKEHAKEVKRRKDVVRKVFLKPRQHLTQERLDSSLKELRSRPKFANRLTMLGVDPPMKISPTTDKETFAFAKNDLEFLQLLHHPDKEVRGLVEAKLIASSSIHETRPLRMIEHARPALPIYLNYAGAKNTHRWSGSDKMNPQNQSRTSKLRHAIRAPKGHKLVIGDSGAIEARLNGYMADQDDLMNQFRAYDDTVRKGKPDEREEPYCQFASKLYNKTVTKKNKLERYVGKVCIAKGQPVLTDRGIFPIEKVPIDTKVWDGIEWVDHDGVVFQGFKEVMTYDGLTATPDHGVFTDKLQPISLQQAASKMDRLSTTGNGRQAIRISNYKIHRTKTSKWVHTYESAVRKMRHNTVGIQEQYNKWEIQRLHTMQTPSPSTDKTSPCADFRKTTLHQPKRFSLQTIWRERYSIQLPLHIKRWVMDPIQLRYSALQRRVRSSRQRWSLRARQSSMGYSQTTNVQPPMFEILRIMGIQIPRMALCGEHCTPSNTRRTISDGNPQEGSIGRSREKKALAKNTNTVAVYDILNCGPRHRFTVSNKLVSNCILALGYQMGAPRFQFTLETGGLGPRITLEQQLYKEYVDMYRQEMNMIVSQWRYFQNRIKDMADKKAKPSDYKCIEFGYRKVTPPNYLALHYPNLRTNEEGDFVYRDKTKLYGGKLVENCIAAGTEILTDSRWILIEQYTPSMKLWDGIEWVYGEKLIDSGVQTVIPCAGVYMTPDHEVLTYESWQTAAQLQNPNIRYIDNDRELAFEWVRANPNLTPSDTSEVAAPTLAGTRTSQVYDILNCGPRHRFTVRGPNGRAFIVHNCIQNLARTCVAEQLLTIAKHHKIVLMVHDEGVFCVPTKKAKEVARDLQDALSTPPEWAPDLPVTGEVGIFDHYVKM